VHTNFWSESLTGRDHAEDLGVDGKIILEWILVKWWESADCMHLPQDRDQWRSVVYTVTNLRVP
jgi:hypothetical protein